MPANSPLLLSTLLLITIQPYKLFIHRHVRSVRILFTTHAISSLSPIVIKLQIAVNVLGACQLLVVAVRRYAIIQMVLVVFVFNLSAILITGWSFNREHEVFSRKANFKSDKISPIFKFFENATKYVSTTKYSGVNPPPPAKTIMAKNFKKTVNKRVELAKNELAHMIQEFPKFSTRKASSAVKLSFGCVRSFLKDDLHLKPCKEHGKHLLKPADYANRVEFWSLDLKWKILIKNVEEIL